MIKVMSTCVTTGHERSVFGQEIWRRNVRQLLDVVLIYSSLDGQLLSSLQLSDPIYVAVVHKSTAAVSMLGRQIVILDLGLRGQLSKRETI